MGLALVPQAGVAIGLAFLGERLLPGERGQLLLTIILSSSVLYEMVGPVCAKLALIFSGCITAEKVKEVDDASGEQMAIDILTGDVPPQEDETERPLSETEEIEETDEIGETEENSEKNPDAEVSLVEHLQELEMGVENQEIYDIEKEVAPDKKETAAEKKSHDTKADKHKKKKSRRKR